MSRTVAASDEVLSLVREAPPRSPELWGTRHTNRNEVGRAAVVGLVLTAVAGRLGVPLAFVDVGCSAGVNLLCDRSRLDYGAAGVTDPARAPVMIEGAVVGGRPPIASALPSIVEQIGINVDPVDVTDAYPYRALLRRDTGRFARGFRLHGHTFGD